MVAVVCILFALTLGSLYWYTTTTKKVPGNTIQSMQLTDEQKRIVDLLKYDKSDIELFSYKSEEQYKEIRVWVEVYKDGVLQSDHGGDLTIMPMEGRKTEGNLAILISKEPDFRWTIVLEAEEGGKITTTSEPCPYYSNSYAYGPINEPLTIEAGKEIVLYTALFQGDNNGLLMFGDAQEFVTNPDLVKDYAFAHIIKCKFTAKSE